MVSWPVPNAVEACCERLINCWKKGSIRTVWCVGMISLIQKSDGAAPPARVMNASFVVRRDWIRCKRPAVARRRAWLLAGSLRRIGPNSRSSRCRAQLANEMSHASVSEGLSTDQVSALSANSDEFYAVRADDVEWIDTFSRQQEGEDWRRVERDQPEDEGMV